MGLFHFVEQHHGEGTATHLLGQLAAFLVAHVAWRGAEEPGDGVLLRVLGHVQGYQRIFLAEEELRQRLGQLGLAHTGGAGEDERAAGAVRVLQSGTGAADRLGDRLDRRILADDPLVQLVFHVQQAGGLFLGQLHDRDAGRVGQHLGDQLLGDLRDFVHIAIAPGLFLLVAGLDELGFLVAQRRGAFEVLGVNRRFLLQAHGGDFLVHFLQRRRSGHALDAQSRPGLVDQVNGLVRQEAVRDVAVGQLGGGLQGAVGDRDAVVRLIAVTQPTQDLRGQLHRRFLDLDRLEAALQRGVLLNVLAVLIQGRGADGLQLTAGQHRLEDAGGVDGALGGTGTDQGVDLIDEQDDVPAGADFLQHLLQALFEVTAVTGAGHQGSQVQGVQLLVLDGLGHVAAHDRLGQALYDRGLADARLTDQHRVVLGAPGKDLHDAFHLMLATDHRVELALAGCGCQVAAELVQYGRASRGALALAAGADARRGGVLPALVTRQQLDDLLTHASQVCTELDQHLCGHALAFTNQAQQDVLSANVVVAQLQRFAQRELQNLLGARSERDMSRWGLLPLANNLLHLFTHGAQGDVQGLERFGCNSVTFVDEPEQQVLGADVVVVEHARLFLGEHDNATGTVGKSLKHCGTLLAYQ